MYSNKDNVNILTAMLVAHGIRHAVVCPGSRNAPIVHNLTECPSIECHNVTDERSAGFYALGMAQTTRQPVVVCVTSGTALLNLMPSVAEAKYQHVPVVVISGDRPAQWIDQLDGQTLPQVGALEPYVRRSVSLPEPHTQEEHWLCNRMVNEALALATHREPCPVHINVPITEPLFQFTTAELPDERMFSISRAGNSTAFTSDVAEALAHCHKPMIVMGCSNHAFIDRKLMNVLERDIPVLYEPLMASATGAVHFDEVLKHISKDETDYYPDLIIYIGGTLVSKRLRQFLRRSGARTWMITTDARDISDPTMHLERILEIDAMSDVGPLLESMLLSDTGYVDGDWTILWRDALSQMEDHAADFEPVYSQLAAVKYLEEQLSDMETPCHVHYANSTSVRLACLYADHHVWCNRGVNGIEGSLSTAAGFSLATTDMVVCVVGDLSFFYDQNALWNTGLRGNLRIILLNNHRGGIFGLLHGLGDSAAALPSVAGAHTTSARGICDECDVGYMSASNMEEMQMGVITLLTRHADRPMLLEVNTDADVDNSEYKRFYK